MSYWTPAPAAGYFLFSRLIDELQIPALNALRANRVVGAKTRIIPERYEAFATLGNLDYSFYGYHLPFPLHDWPGLDGDNGWQMLSFNPLTEAVKVFDLRFSDYNDPHFNTRLSAESYAEGTVNAIRLSGLAHLTPGLVVGPTVAFNGNKLIPVEPFSVGAGEPIFLSLSANRGG
jgi:hypothetical protein